MQVTINGKCHELEAATPLSRALHRLAIEEHGIAIAVNDAVVPRAKWDGLKLRDGDRIEIIHAVQGG